MPQKMVVSPRLPGRLQTLQKQPRINSASKRPMMEFLPLDALEAIMGFLDEESLCTARLVSKSFYAAASVHVCSLTLASTSKTVSFHRYPHLRHVTVTHDIPYVRDAEEESSAQMDPCLRDVATALTVKACLAGNTQTRGYLSQAALMPKLRELFVEGGVEYGAALLARCTNLEAIRFSSCSTSIARTIVTLTRLIFLDISIDEDGSEDEDEDQDDTFWLERLRSLQALRTYTVYRDLSDFGNLTWLTGLTLLSNEEDSAMYSIAPLTRLTRLRSLCFDWGMTESNLAIACSLGSGSLVDLQLRVWAYEASADCARFLSRQTALTRLSLLGQQLCKLRHIGGNRIELLQCLELKSGLEAEDLPVLSRATSLSKFSISSSTWHPLLGLSQAVARLTQLRSLRLSWSRWGHDPPSTLDLPLALSPLMALTKLHLESDCLDDGDLGAVLGLTGLRALELRSCRLTDGVLPALAVLTRLSSLTIADCGITSLAPVSEALNPLRYARGWPPLHTSLG